MEQKDILKNYLLSNKQILDILTSDNNNNNWSEDDFYAISGRDINHWKSFINFDKLFENNNKNIDDLEYIANLNINEEIKKNYLDIGYNSINKMDDEKILEDFELVSKQDFESYIKDKKDINFKKALIKKGFRKIIIKENETSYFILYLDKRDEKDINIIKKKIAPKDIDKYLIYISIKIEKEPQKDLLNSFIGEILKTDIDEWIKKNKFDISNKTNIYKEITFTINKIVKKKELFPNFGHISYIKNNLIISKSLEKSLIKDINYINTMIVVKVKNASFVIASMSSLSQINELAEYFLGQNVMFNNCSQLLSEFQIYINTLWKNTNEKYKPINFMKVLKLIFEHELHEFDFDTEKEPIIFLNNIFEYINKELNNKDKDIENELINFKYNFNDENFDNYYYNEFIKYNNSIISKLFYGIFFEKNICESCEEKHFYKKFKYIDLNITKYSEYLCNSDELDNSLVYYYLDDLIKFYFTEENRTSKCPKCKKEIKIIKKIIKFPDVLIFRINWGQFSKEKGFDYEEKLKKDRELMLEHNKLIFSDIIDLTDFNYNQNNIKEYKIRSIINYPIIDDKNKDDKSWKKFITFSRHIVDNNFYSYQPSGIVCRIHKYNRKKFVPSVLFYEKLK